MHPLSVIPVLLLIAVPGMAQLVGTDITPAAAQQDRTEARWAEWEAESRIVQGDYDGAVQAEQQAKADWQKIEPRETEDSARKR